MTQWVKAFAIKLDTFKFTFKFNSLDPCGSRGETTTGFPVASTCILWYTHMHTFIHTNVIKKYFIFLSTSLAVQYVKDNVRNWVLHLGTNK